MTLPDTRIGAPRTRSAFPRTVEDCMSDARRKTMSLGEIPSVRQLKDYLHVGTDKAKEVQSRLTGEFPDLVLLVDKETGKTVREVDDLADTPQDRTYEMPRKPSSLPLFLLALPPFIAIWGGWVGLGELTGFGQVHPFPGMPFGLDKISLNTAVTLPISMEAYAGYAIRVWLSRAVSRNTRRFAGVSALGSFAVGAMAQMSYHLLKAAHMTAAPPWLTALVACVPVVAAGLGFFLGHKVHTDEPIPSDEGKE